MRFPQFSMGCLIWVVAVVSLVVGILRMPEPPALPRVLIAPLGLAALIVWGAFLLSREAKR